MQPSPHPCRTPRVTRRKVLTILAAGVGAVLPVPGHPIAGKGQAPTYEWRGRALGAPAGIVVRHSDEIAARRLLRHCVREIDRLENIFSLYRRDSELCRLNRDGRLRSASIDLRLVLAESRRFGELSDGVFDVTIQPLWQLYRRHFAAAERVRSGPDPRRLEQVIRLIDYHGIDADSHGLRFVRDGMSVSLNGIAQGYFTDRITELLRDAGMSDVLVDLGEIRALGSDGAKPWQIGIENPADPRAATGSVALHNAAMATSGGYGTRFDEAGRFHHLFDPATGECPGRVVAATAIAGNAMRADALSTALAVAPPERAETLLRAFGAISARLVLSDDRIVELRV